MVEPSTSNVNEATAQDTDEDQSKSIMEVEESNEAIEKSSVPTSSSAEPAITTASNVSKVREHTEMLSDFFGSFLTPTSKCPISSKVLFFGGSPNTP